MVSDTIGEPKYMNWLNLNAPAVQALCAITIVVLTGLLAWYAFQSVKRTDRALHLSGDQLKEQQKSLVLLESQIVDQRKSFELAREEFEREWQPQMRAFVHRTHSQDVRLDLVNLGRIAIHVESLEVGIGHGTSLKVQPFEYIQLISVNGSRSENIHTYLISALKEQLVVSNLRDCDGNMAVRVSYFSAGASHMSDWTHFGFVMRREEIIQITPMLG